MGLSPKTVGPSGGKVSRKYLVTDEGLDTGVGATFKPADWASINGGIIEAGYPVFIENGIAKPWVDTDATTKAKFHGLSINPFNTADGDFSSGVQVSGTIDKSLTPLAAFQTVAEAELGTAHRFTFAKA